MSKKKTTPKNSSRQAPKPAPPAGPSKSLIIIGLLAVALIAGIAWANVSGSRGTATAASPTAPSAAAPVVEQKSDGTAQLINGVQKVAVRVTYKYSPDVIRLKSGVPTEITFSEGQGCTAVVQSQDLGFQEDLSGGPKTVKLQGLQPGTYGFTCGMNMVRGSIVVE